MYLKNKNQEIGLNKGVIRESKANNVWRLIESNPKLIFNLKGICQIYNFKYKGKIEPLRASTIISRLYDKRKIVRTRAQLEKGYLYSLDNKKELERLYETYLYPYGLDNRDEIIKLLTKNKFGKLRTNVEFLSGNIGAFMALNVGFLMCDGHIKKNLLQVRYYFNQKQDAELFKSDFLSFFPKEKILIEHVSSCYTLTICNKNLATLINSLGVPTGNKVYQSFMVPDWIYHGPDSLKRTFLSIIYGNEGSKPSNNKWRIQFVLSKAKEFVPDLLLFLNQIRAMLNHFDISTSNIQLRKQKERAFCGRFYIKGKENLIRFYQKIGFLYASEKQKVLESLILKGKS